MPRFRSRQRPLSLVTPTVTKKPAVRLASTAGFFFESIRVNNFDNLGNVSNFNHIGVLTRHIVYQQVWKRHA